MLNYPDNDRNRSNNKNLAINGAIVEDITEKTSKSGSGYRLRTKIHVEFEFKPWDKGKV